MLLASPIWLQNFHRFQLRHFMVFVAHFHSLTRVFSGTILLQGKRGVVKMKDKFYLTINGVRWTVRGCSGDAPELESDGDNVLGITRFATAEIFVQSTDITEDIVYRTLKHELGHAYLYSYGFIGDEMGEEDFCNFIESYGERLINDARKVFKSFLKPRIIAY